MAPKREGAVPPEGYDTRSYPPFAVTVDIVILTLVDGRLEVLLVQRSADPFAGMWALPGGFKVPDETLDEAAARELREETGVDAAAHLSQFGSYGDPGRDPRMNVVTVAYLAVLRDVGPLQSGSDAAEATLWPVSAVVDGSLELAFDHRRIVSDAVARARVDLETTSLATAFVGPAFTLSELRNVYEAVWDTRLDPANFRRSVLSAKVVEPMGERSLAQAPQGGRPPELYAASPAWDEGAPVRRPKPKDRPKDRPQDRKEDDRPRSDDEPES